MAKLTLTGWTGRPYATYCQVTPDQWVCSNESGETWHATNREAARNVVDAINRFGFQLAGDLFKSWSNKAFALAYAKEQETCLYLGDDAERLFHRNPNWNWDWTVCESRGPRRHASPHASPAASRDPIVFTGTHPFFYYRPHRSANSEMVPFASTGWHEEQSKAGVQRMLAAVIPAGPADIVSAYMHSYEFRESHFLAFFRRVCSDLMDMFACYPSTWGLSAQVRRDTSARVCWKIGKDDRGVIWMESSLDNFKFNT